MELYDYSLDQDMFKRVGARAFRQCEASDVVRSVGGKLGITLHRCGAAAIRGITWEGIEGQHSLLVCDRHTLAYLGPMIGKGRD